VRSRDPFNVTDAKSLEAAVAHLAATPGQSVFSPASGGAPVADRVTFVVQKGEPGAWDDVLRTVATPASPSRPPLGKIPSAQVTAALAATLPDHVALGALGRFASSYDKQHFGAGLLGSLGYVCGGLLGTPVTGSFSRSAASGSRKLTRAYYTSYLLTTPSPCTNPGAYELKLVKMRDRSPRLLRVGEVEVQRQEPFHALDLAIQSDSVADCDTACGEGLLVQAVHIRKIAAEDDEDAPSSWW